MTTMFLILKFSMVIIDMLIKEIVSQIFFRPQFMHYVASKIMLTNFRKRFPFFDKKIKTKT